MLVLVDAVRFRQPRGKLRSVRLNPNPTQSGDNLTPTHDEYQKVG
jgi:hypothetical protein